MARIDLKNCIVRLSDGGAQSATIDCTAANSDFVVTRKAHTGAFPISIRLVDPGTTASLSIDMDEFDITVNLAYATGAVTSTANDVIAALAAHTLISKLITPSLASGSTGVGLVNAKAKATLTGTQKSIEVKIGDGDFQFTQNKPRQYLLDRGNLDSTRDDNQQPVEIDIDSVWEFYTAASGGTETFEDALNQDGEASDWVTSDSDTCQPYSLDLEIDNSPACTGTREVLVFPKFRYEKLTFSASKYSLTCSGKANVVRPTVYRVDAS